MTLRTSQRSLWVFTLLCLWLPALGYAQRRDPSEWKWVDPNIAEGCLHRTLHSPSMDREIGYSIFLPPSYEEQQERRYPVVYYLHGAGGSESSSREFAWAVRQAIRDEVIDEVIFVFPNGGHYGGYRDWEDGSVMAETWIIKELIPHIDANFRTIPERDSRALCGWSMGGGGSLRFLMKYPEKFCAAATMSAAVTMRGGDAQDSAVENLRRNIEQIRGRAGIWMAVGADDRLKSGNEQFSKALKELEVEHSLTILPETGHNLGEMSAKFHRDIVLFLNEHLVAEAEKNSKSSNRVLTDLSYKADPETEYERERCKLDLYLPASGEGFPTIVWFHGGGLQAGHKAGEHEVAMAKRFAADGMAVASVNYRLSPRAKYPAYLEDAAAAVAFVAKNIKNYGGDPEQVYVSGHSAGGYLTAMVGVQTDLLEQYKLSPASLAGFLPISGQMITHSTVREERGISRTQPIIDVAAPSFHAKPETAPFLCIAGSEDLPARAAENQYFVAAMKAAGHPHIQYLEFAGRDHTTIASLLNRSEDAVAASIKNFLISQGAKLGTRTAD